MGLLDLEQNYAFYGAYHNNEKNRLIHILCVWPILFTVLLLLNYTPPLFETSLAFPGSEYLVFNVGFLAALVYSVYYILLQPQAGLLATYLIGICVIGSQAAFQALGAENAWKVALGVQLFSWTAQLIGHGIFEKRAPTLLDNFAQAFLMAPFFVLLEVLKSAFGYEPSPGFWERVHAKVAEDIREFRAKKEMLLKQDDMAAAYNTAMKNDTSK